MRLYVFRGVVALRFLRDGKGTGGRDLPTSGSPSGAMGVVCYVFAVISKCGLGCAMRLSADDDLFERVVHVRCTDDGIALERDSHAGLGGGFDGVAHFIGNDADIAHRCRGVRMTKHSRYQHHVAAVAVVRDGRESATQRMRRISGRGLDEFRYIIDAAMT